MTWFVVASHPAYREMVLSQEQGEWVFTDCFAEDPVVPFSSPATAAAGLDAWRTLWDGRDGHDSDMYGRAEVLLSLPRCFASHPRTPRDGGLR